MLRPRKPDGAAAQPLHGEGKVRQAVAIGQRFARQGQSTGLDFGRIPPVRCGDAGPQQPGGAHRPDQAAAAFINVGGRGRRKFLAVGELLNPAHVFAVSCVKEGQFHLLTLVQRGRLDSGHRECSGRRSGALSLF
ncbi:hypothetical protein D3C72_1897980 [compost metagenome]